MKSLCSEFDIAICGSVAFKLDDGTGRNRGLFVTPNGEVNIYDKKHLFTLGGEGENYVPGQIRTVVEFKDGNSYCKSAMTSDSQFFEE